MNRRQLLYLCVALGLAVAGGTQATSTATLQRQASVDIVSQEQGLLAVEQTTTGYNNTTGAADVSVTVTNQRPVHIPPLEIRIGDKSVSTEALAPGESDTIRLLAVACTELIRVETTMDETHLQITTPVTCS